jgi:hypothetical protein
MRTAHRIRLSLSLQAPFSLYTSSTLCDFLLALGGHHPRSGRGHTQEIVSLSPPFAPGSAGVPLATLPLCCPRLPLLWACRARGGRARREAAGGMAAAAVVPSPSSRMPPKRPPARPRRRACSVPARLGASPRGAPRAHTLVSQPTPPGPALPPLQPRRLEPCRLEPARRQRAWRWRPQRVPLEPALPAFERTCHVPTTPG